MKTPEEMYYEWRQAFDESLDERMCKGEPIELQLLHRELGKETFLAGYKAAKEQVADVSKVITYDYVETASNEAKELIATFGLIDNEDVLIKALVAAYCSGVDAVDGYLRNSLSAYRASVKNQQWISVKNRLPEMNELCIVNTEWRGVVPATYGNESWIFDDGQGWSEKALSYASHWMPLPAPPKEEK